MPQVEQKPDANPPIISDPDSFADSDFINPQPPELHYTLCKRVPRKPKRSKCCNVLYCEPCSRKQEKCPVHKQKKEYVVDSDLRNKVYKTYLHCTKRCGWKGTWAKMKEYLKECGVDKKSKGGSEGGREICHMPSHSYMMHAFNSMQLKWKLLATLTP